MWFKILKVLKGSQIVIICWRWLAFLFFTRLDPLKPKHLRRFICTHSIFWLLLNRISHATKTCMAKLTISVANKDLVKPLVIPNLAEPLRLKWSEKYASNICVADPERAGFEPRKTSEQWQNNIMALCRGYLACLISHFHFILEKFDQ